MTTVRLTGYKPGTLVDLTFAVGSSSDSVVVSSYRLPVAIDDVPFLSDAMVGDVMAVDTGSLTSITNYDFREVGVGSIQNGATDTLDTTNHGGKWIEVVVTANGVDYTSPPNMVYTVMDPDHAKDDAAIRAILPHNEVSHLAVQGGNWSNPATWNTGTVPYDGANVLVPKDIQVVYDEQRRGIIRLDRVRVEGTLTWALDRSTYMLVETLIGTRESQIIIGTGPSERVPAAYTHTIEWSGRDYQARGFSDTNLRAADYLKTRGWSRGLVSTGLVRVWGKERTGHLKAVSSVPVGATSVTLSEAPVGVSVGETIVIGGTDIDYTPDNTQVHGLDLQHEVREISDISGNVVSWVTPLVRSHDNQLPDSSRTDLFTTCHFDRGKNVIFISEVKDVDYRRGHFAVMHHMGMMDIWDAEFIDMGRSSKKIKTGLIDENNNFLYYPVQSARPAVETDNLFGRYPVHAHLLGFGRAGDKPVVSNCFVGVTDDNYPIPGWAMVHHDCDMNMNNNVITGFHGGGMIAEAGSEVGEWFNNYAQKCLWRGYDMVGNGLAQGTYETLGSSYNPKTYEGARGASGDPFRYGCGFALRGRAVQSNRNIASDVAFGQVFYPRVLSANDQVVEPLKPRRNDTDLKRLQRPVRGGSEWEIQEYPIIHMNENEFHGCLGGLFVTKQFQTQRHDLTVRFRRLKVWGFREWGAQHEYIAYYALEDYDLVAGAVGAATGDCMYWGANAYTSFTRNIRTEGGAHAFAIDRLDTDGEHDNYDQVINPRYGEVGYDCVDFRQGFTNVFGSADYVGNGGGTSVKPVPDVRLLDPDFDDTAIDYDALAEETAPLVLDTSFDSATGNVSNLPTSSTGKKNDNISTGAELYYKIKRDFPLPAISFFASKYKDWVQTFGYWQYNDGTGVKNYAVIDVLFSDRITGRPRKKYKLIEMTGGTVGTNNGTFVYAATDISIPDKEVVCPPNGSVTVDVLAGATGAGGAGTYVLDYKGNGSGIADDVIQTDFGRVTLDAGAGEITYTPFANFTGIDECFVFVESQGRIATVRVSFLVVASDTGIETPAVTTHFEATDLATPIGLVLKDPPDVSGRTIRQTQYSTDGGTTWGRVCNGWVKAIHKLTTESDGTTPITSGTYNIRIRYKTRYDYQTSAESGDDTVTIT